MNLGHHVDVGGEHVTCVGLQIVIGEGGMEVRKGVPIVSTCWIALKATPVG